MRLLTIILLSVLVSSSALADRGWRWGDSDDRSEPKRSDWWSWSTDEKPGGKHSSSDDDSDGKEDGSGDGDMTWGEYRSSMALKMGNQGAGEGHGHGRAEDRLAELDDKINSGVCDVLADSGRGLKYLCYAFCELQDCRPDYSLENPFQNCSKSSSWLLSVYEARRGAGDPDMPCVKQPDTSAECPCWARNELADLRYNGQPDEISACFRNVSGTGLSNYDAWQMSNVPGGAQAYLSTISTIEMSDADGGPVCSLVDTCDDGNCLGASRFMGLTPAQFAACEADVAQSAANRGLTCVDLGQ
jgi:hypothetical protein